MKKHFLFAAALFAALSLGFVSCENPDDEPGFSLENERGDDKNPDEGVTPPITLEEPMLVATGGATDVEYSSVTLWGRLNTDTLVFFPKVKWGVECSASKEEITTHSGKKKLCTTDLVGENADEFSVELTEVGYGKMLYYNAYLLINDIKYVYGEVDSVHMDVKLTLKTNDSNYGEVTGIVYHDYGSETTITATPKENCYFTGWSDCDSKELTRTVQVNSDTTITAIFSKKPYLTTKPNNSNFGTVEGGSGYYELNTEVTITATPNYYTEFVQWSDGNTENPRTVTVTSNVTYVAEFKVSYTSNFTPAAFSVSSTNQVYFSPGNLQYHPKNKKWRFAPSQLDYIGDGNKNISSTYNGWLDLFGWSTSATNFGVSTSENSEDYLGSFVDWGTNKIGNDAPNTWRTLSYDEWKYLLETRTNASSLKGVAQVNGVNGLILLPDAWTCPDGITFKSGFHDYGGVDYYAAYQTFTADQWSKMEAEGAVFLPAAGNRDGSDVYYVQYYGYFWSPTDNSNDADYLSFYSGGAYVLDHHRFFGRSVRLVKDL